MLKKRTYSQYNSHSKVNIGAMSRLHSHFCLLDTNSAENRLGYFRHARILGIGARKKMTAINEKGSLSELQRFCEASREWLFGYISYDVKNDIEDLSSGNRDELHFPAIQFFVPQLTIIQTESASTAFFDDGALTDSEADEMIAACFSEQEVTPGRSQKPEIKARIRRDEYLEAVRKLKDHIRKGDIYEVNLCQEFYAENAEIDAPSVYERLNDISAAPFSAYGRFGSNHVICASPERFLRKTGNHLISQPIKGTSKRSADPAEDARLKKELSENEKERSENVMIVDLVRNDLSRIAKKGNVNVDELFGIYSFRQVHQMISTVSCDLKKDLSFTEILKAMFPMGSMTGAPKVSAMKLIEKYERTKRGLYSGAIGYISPEGDFDLNVVIRSILYNEENNYLSFMAGSAITDRSDPGKEYEECLLKAKAMFEVLQGTN